MAEYTTMDSGGAFEFDLYQNLSHDATLQQGALKSYRVKEDSAPIYERKKSGYSVNVDRLIWADGWETTVREGADTKHSQEMTLVVLKITLHSEDPDVKIGFMKASLALEDPKAQETGGKNEPELQAWAPFHDWVRWDDSVAHHKQNDRTDLSVSGGYQGSQLSAGRSRDKEISWDQTSFNSGQARPEISSLTRRRNGVTWVMEHNPLENHGVAREIWVTALFSRFSAASYVARFQIDVRAGTMADFENKTRKFFGLKPEQTKAFLVTPWKNRWCYYEGVDIVECIDLDNLAKLRKPGNRSNMVVKWGPDYKLNVSAVLADKGSIEQSSDNTTTGSNIAEKNAIENVAGHSPGEKRGVDVERASMKSFPVSVALGDPALGERPAYHDNSHKAASTARRDPPLLHTTTEAAPSIPVLTAQPTAPGSVQVAPLAFTPLMIGCYTPALAYIADAGRLTALEVRVAETEARLAAHDGALSQLQQALAAKDAQLASLEQRVAALTDK